MFRCFEVLLHCLLPTSVVGFYKRFLSLSYYARCSLLTRNTLKRIVVGVNWDFVDAEEGDLSALSRLVEICDNFWYGYSEGSPAQYYPMLKEKL